MKMYFIEQEHIELMSELLKNSIDNQYVVLSSNGRLCDIAQYSSKYQDIHINTLPVDKLDKKLELHSRGYY